MRWNVSFATTCRLACRLLHTYCCLLITTAVPRPLLLPKPAPVIRFVVFHRQYICTYTLIRQTHLLQGDNNYGGRWSVVGGRSWRVVAFAAFYGGFAAIGSGLSSSFAKCAVEGEAYVCVSMCAWRVITSTPSRFILWLSGLPGSPLKLSYFLHGVNF
ncbi:unnamed protein product [Ceratitis capitata]|uniref:(Mediterranean fruit fly) hypothetical protein n=1 Tax=Ceratitis capitata TaxID=7213 RepID=A0A811UMZ4_CERCA|nr:unnamed protein product [Ceratitis capitata]